MKKLLVFALLLTGIAGCARKKAIDEYAPTTPYVAETVAGGQMTFEFNPKVVVLFVIDNSTSMGEKPDKNRASSLEKLQKGVDLFVDGTNEKPGFGENNVIDYRVGAITVYDHRRCGTIDPKTNDTINCYPEGKLRKPFVTRGENSKQKIKDALNVGTLPMSGALPTDEDGPRFEELFSPILTALSPAMNATNGNFIDKDTLVQIIMITDEDDGGMLAARTFPAAVEMALGHKNFDLYGVVATKGCPRTSYADFPDRIIEAVREARGTIFPICDENFGTSLAEIGSDIRERLVKHEIPLPAVPEVGTLVLKYGDQAIPQGKGWTYNPRSQKITINSDLNVKFDPKSKFSVSYTRVEEKAIRKGRATPEK